MTEVTKESYIRAIVVNIEENYNSLVVNENITILEFASETLEDYRNLSKYRIITI